MPSATPEQLADESRRVRKVRQLVDIASNLIMQSRMSREDAEMLIATVRDRVLALFPDGADAYELIYAPRFRRLIDEFAVPRTARGGIILPFAPRHR
jgi:hypothetical protein